MFVAVLRRSAKASHPFQYQGTSFFRLALINQVNTRIMRCVEMVSHRAQFLRYLLLDCRFKSEGIVHSVKPAVERSSIFSTEGEYEEVSLVSNDDDGVSSDISICSFNKVCAQYDEAVQPGGLSDHRVRHHNQREKEASSP